MQKNAQFDEDNVMSYQYRPQQDDDEQEEEYDVVDDAHDHADDYQHDDDEQGGSDGDDDHHHNQKQTTATTKSVAPKQAVKLPKQDVDNEDEEAFVRQLTFEERLQLQAAKKNEAIAQQRTNKGKSTTAPAMGDHGAPARAPKAPAQEIKKRNKNAYVHTFCLQFCWPIHVLQT